MASRIFLVVWGDRKCVEVTEYSEAGEAQKRSDAINGDYLSGNTRLHSTIYYASSREAVESDPACRVGGYLDEKYRDEMDWSSDFAEDGWDC